MNPKTAEALTLVARHHKEFVKTAQKLYGNNYDVTNYAEDFIQDCYLKLSRYDNLYEKIIRPDGSVSKGYIFFCLRSVILNALKKKRVLKYNYMGDQYDMEETYMLIDEGRDPIDEARDEIEELMYQVAEKHSDWFDYKLFRTYLETGKSFRTLAKETGLGIQTIYLSIKKTKLLVADKLFDLYKETIKK